MLFSRKTARFLIINLICYFSTITLYGQGDFVSLYTFYPNSNCSITIKVKKSKIKCEEVNDIKRVRNKVSIENSATLEGELNAGRINKYFSWEFETTNCAGEHFIIPVSIDLTQFSTEGVNDLADQTFEAIDFKIVDNSVKNKINPTKPRPKPNQDVAPSLIEGPKEAYSGDDIELTAKGGIIKTLGSKYVWVEGSVNGKVIVGAETSTLKIKAANNTKKYFVYITGNKTDYASTEVKILTISKKADRINGPAFVCNNTTKKISLEVIGGGLGETPSGGKAEWVWRINSETGPIIERGQRISIDQPVTPTTYFVAPEGVNKVGSVSHQIEVVAPTDFSKATIITSMTKICQGQNVNLELQRANLNASSKINWYETNGDHFKKIISNSLSFSFTPLKTSTYGVYVTDQCVTTPELQANITVVENSVLPYEINVDSSKKGRIVELSIKNSFYAKLNNNSNWVWYIPNEAPKYDDLSKPVGAQIINTGSTTINFNASKSKTIAVKAFGECESNERVTTVIVSRKLDKYFFFTIGASSNEMGNLATKVITIGSHRVYFRTRQSLNATAIGDYKTNSFVTDGKSITNFPANSGNYYSFNGEKVNLRSSYTVGFFLNQNDVKVYLGGGMGSQSYYNGVDISSYQNGTTSKKSWAQNVNFNNSGAELEAGISVKLKPFYMMAGASYLMGSAPSKGYISVDLNIGFAF
ncbi:hypothetical protein U8695_07455 [Aquirufa antheringensis]